MGQPPVLTSSGLLLHFCSGSLALASLNLACRNLVPAFPQCSLPSLFDDSSLRWLETGTSSPTSKGLPSSPVQLRMPFGPAMLVTQDPTETWAAQDFRSVKALFVPSLSVISSPPWHAHDSLRESQMVIRIRRREFIVAISGAAAAWPLAARAQQAAMPVIGFCHLISPEARREYLAYFHRGLAEIGYIEGRNVEIEYRWAYGQNDRLPILIAELVRQRVAVIVILESTHGALAAKAATQTIPIVFMQGADSVQIGLVRSLNQPGGNVTGIDLHLVETVAKRLELLHESVPA